MVLIPSPATLYSPGLRPHSGWGELVSCLLQELLLLHLTDQFTPKSFLPPVTLLSPCICFLGAAKASCGRDTYLLW